ncbi:MAG TPA: hydroxymethylglutaryl-CoA reductase [Kineosporiaceae bacterium]|nr:hydroxymethylglutaryl-CoA reductase [Kineosporiaceae bacterium]
MVSMSLVNHLYTVGSLRNAPSGPSYRIKNRLFAATLTAVKDITIDGVPCDPGTSEIVVGDAVRPASSITASDPLLFSLGTELEVRLAGPPLLEGAHTVAAEFVCDPFGPLAYSAVDYIVQPPPDRPHIPRLADDWSVVAVKQRQQFVEDVTGVRLEHVSSMSYDPMLARGNIEHLTGTVQIPVGIAGPLLVNGEHAHGEYLIPLATSEGTLVASYNRGMKVLNAAGGVKCTVQDDSMQRAPVFIFDSAREAREFRSWLRQNLPKITEVAESTTTVGKLLRIETYLAHRFAFCRFDYTTGDAAGQNMVSNATFAATSWIISQRPEIRHFYLESNFATDKKSSQVNVMHTRGKRVTAEAWIPRQVLAAVMRVTPEGLVRHGAVANVGAFLSGAVNNGLQSANGITAMFIACGQDVANVAESSAAVIHSEVVDDGLYLAITLPSLIVATYGGGTGLPTQSECLAMLGCAGPGKVNKLAEIVAGTVLAGEISLASAISALDWVSSHERYGRNR